MRERRRSILATSRSRLTSIECGGTVNSMRTHSFPGAGQLLDHLEEEVAGPGAVALVDVLAAVQVLVPIVVAELAGAVALAAGVAERLVHRDLVDAGVAVEVQRVDARAPDIGQKLGQRLASSGDRRVAGRLGQIRRHQPSGGALHVLAEAVA